MPKKVSIIVPVYNVSKYLARCLDSIKNQTYSNWEAICVNDGSTDNSLDILNEYAKADSRFIVVSKSNGGLSDARNVGMRYVTGDYTMYIDSDDFIHCQTIELACAFAERDGSDIVSWYKDTKYTRRLRLLFKRDGKEHLDLIPKNFNKKFKISNIRTKVTNDIVSNMSEENCPWMLMPIKHFYVVRHLIKTELIRDIQFIPGLKYEDFPWWSEVMLKNPRTTITSLRIYYYCYNPTSITIVMKDRYLSKMEHWIKGLTHTHNLYKDKATQHQIDEWTKNCKWPVIKYQILRELANMSKEEMREIKPKLLELEKAGVLDYCKGFRNKLIKRKMLKFLHSPIEK